MENGTKKKNAVRCSLCQRSVNARMLRVHLARKHSVTKKCKLCLEYDLSDFAIQHVKCSLICKQHLSPGSEELYECVDCDYRSVKPSAIKAHFNKRHQDSPRYAFMNRQQFGPLKKCPEEGCSFETNNNVDMRFHHEMKHLHSNSLAKKSNNLHCPACSFRAAELKEMYMHTSEKHHIRGCQQCLTSGMSDAQSSRYNVIGYVCSKHSKGNAVSSFFCLICGTAAASWMQARQHWISNHQILCPVEKCSFVATNNAMLDDHQSISHRKLDADIIIEPINSYKCTLCVDQILNSKVDLNKHFKDVHGISSTTLQQTYNKSRYSCSFCEFVTNYAVLMEEHQRLKHSYGMASVDDDIQVFHECPFCVDFRTLEVQNLLHHTLEVHRISREQLGSMCQESLNQSSRFNRFTCRFEACNSISPSLNQLVEHWKSRHPSHLSTVVTKLHLEKSTAQYIQKARVNTPTSVPASATVASTPTTTTTTIVINTQSQRKFYCCYCSEAFLTKLRYVEHYVAQHKSSGSVDNSHRFTTSNSYECPECEFASIYVLNTRQHVEKSHKKQAVEHSDHGFFCAFCFHQCLDKSDLQLHTKTEHQAFGQDKTIPGALSESPTKIASFHCPFCHLTFEDFSQTRGHVTRKHIHQLRPVLSCCFCNNNYDNDGDLQKHYHTTHTLPMKKKERKGCRTDDFGLFPCPNCSFRSSSSASLQSHYLESCSKTKELVLCCFCNTLVCRGDELDAHYQAHLSQPDEAASSNADEILCVKFYECPKCAYKDDEQASMKRHVRGHYKRAGAQPSGDDAGSVSPKRGRHNEEDTEAGVEKTSPSSFSCRLCSFTTASEDDFVFHLTEVHL